MARRGENRYIRGMKDLPTPHRHAGRVIAIEDIGVDIRILKVALPHGQKPAFSPGQYMRVGLAGDAHPRCFSIACAPGLDYFEFHIRNTGHGASAQLATALKPGDTVMLEGPHGRNIWQTQNRPALLLAGGIGIAPMKAMIESCMAAAQATPVTLYWGVRDARHLYLEPLFRALTRRHSHFAYIPVVEDEDGTIGPVLARNMQDLGGHDVYMAGPMPMIEALLPVLDSLNADRTRVFSDAFSV